MKRKLILLNVALIAVLSLLAYTLRQRWLEGRAQEEKVRNAQVTPVPPPLIQPKAPVAPLKAANYAEVAEKVLFAQDRNPNVILPPPPPPPAPAPVPPFPVAHGVMIFGSVPPTVLLSEKGKAEQQSYQVGDKVGEFRIVSIDNQQVAFEWSGKIFRKNISDLEDNSAPAETQPQVASAGQPVQQAPPPPAQPEVTSYSGGQGPGRPLSERVRACQDSDSMPAGAVVDGYRKIAGATPFSGGKKLCSWIATQ